MAIPQLIFALMLLSIFGASVLNLILIIAVLDSTRVFRLSRAVAMNVVVMDYVEAARLRGEKHRLDHAQARSCPTSCRRWSPSSGCASASSS